jgi:hypothetical protein
VRQFTLDGLPSEWMADRHICHHFKILWEPLWECQCQHTVKLILTIQHILQEWQEFFRGSVVGEVYSKETSDTIVALQSIDFLYERIDEAAIAVRSYQPKCHSETVAAFQMQKYARDRLKILINGLREIVDLMDELYPEEGTTVVESKPLLLPVAQTEEKTNKGLEEQD